MKEYDLIHSISGVVVGKIICNDADEVMKIDFETNLPKVNEHFDLAIRPGFLRVYGQHHSRIIQYFSLE